MKKEIKKSKKCLKCGKKFTSKWIGNRVCQTCKKQDDWW